MVKYEQRKNRLYSGEDKLLLELRVRDLGIIEKIDWRLGKGLNVITGETGAGKSLVIDAVEALLGGKVDEDAIRHGTQAASIEGIFTLPKSYYETYTPPNSLFNTDHLSISDSAGIRTLLRPMV